MGKSRKSVKLCQNLWNYARTPSEANYNMPVVNFPVVSVVGFQPSLGCDGLRRRSTLVRLIKISTTAAVCVSVWKPRRPFLPGTFRPAWGLFNPVFGQKAADHTAMHVRIQVTLQTWTPIVQLLRRKYESKWLCTCGLTSCLRKSRVQR